VQGTAENAFVAARMIVVYFSELNMEKKSTLRSVTRATDILLYFANCDEVGITELSKDLKLAKSTTHNILKALKDKGLIEQNIDNNKYHLGAKIFQLGMRWIEGRDVRVVSRQHMQQLSKELGTILHLCILAGDQVLIVERTEPSIPFIAVPKAGWTLPIHSSASGKLLLAYSPKEAVQRIIRETKLTKFTGHTITDAEQLAMVVEKVSQQGYAVEVEETADGVICFAAPIRDYSRVVIASISICTSVERCPLEKYPEFITKIKRQADTISTNLGYHI
jgi:IclR family transcriptional regulator, KDG regulon repressor